MPEPAEASDPVVAKRAWPAGLLLAVVQLVVVLLLGWAFQYRYLFSSVVFWLYIVELIAGLVWWSGGKFSYEGRILVFAALFPVALSATLLLVAGGLCLMMGGK